MQIDPSSVLIAALAFATGVVTLMGGGIIWIVKETSKQRDQIEVNRLVESGKSNSIHEKYQALIGESTSALNNLSKVVENQTRVVESLEVTVHALVPRL